MELDEKTAKRYLRKWLESDDWNRWWRRDEYKSVRVPLERVLELWYCVTDWKRAYRAGVRLPPHRRWPAVSLPSLCAACKGGCCRNGGNRAYIDMEQVVKYGPMAYLRAVPLESIEGACIYLTERGCVLPKKLLSTTCRVYACAAMRHALADTKQQGR